MGRWIGVIVSAAVVAAGCTTAGPRALRTGRVAYNEVVNQTNNEQLLLNLVRLRYRDTPLFLGVAGISTQYALEASAGADISGSDGEGFESYGGSLGIGYAEKPTISFSPLQGEKYVTEMLSPISAETIALLFHSGWNFDRIARCVVQGMNGVLNAPNASSPTPSAAPRYRDFQRATEQLRALQKRAQLSLGLSVEDGEPVITLFVAPDAVDSPELADAMTTFGMPAGRSSYRIVPGLWRVQEEVISANTRSLMGVLYYLSHGVEVPPAHEQAGLVTVTRTEAGDRFDWTEVTGDLLHIRWSASPPRNAAVKVLYRGVWFYVSDADLDSKSTFIMLSELFALQAGSVPASSPVLTLPLG